MAKKIYVGNLPFSTTNESLSALFAQFGKVDSSKIITDRETGQSKGFGFIEMSNSDEALSAISKLNGIDHEGRNLTVNEARPMQKRDSGFIDRREKNSIPNHNFNRTVRW
jgi:cold-inducible RNA-binding protein